MVLGPDCIRAQEHEGRDEVIDRPFCPMERTIKYLGRMPFSALPIPPYQYRHLLAMRHQQLYTGLKIVIQPLCSTS